MSPIAKKSFTAVLERDGTALQWIVARVPAEIAKACGRSVRGDIDGVAFRTTLFPHPRGGGLVVLVNKKMRTAAKVELGAAVRIRLERDPEERPTETPAELEKYLRADRALKQWYLKLSPSNRREAAKWINEPKSAESRQKRAVKMAERLLQAMEGELEPPPVLRAIFQRQPLAHAGWEALTPVQRRNHLLGIFYYETPEARERRAEKAVADALQRFAGKSATS
jgi:uncharacterized protein YdeI (YjbR/CyaY-like superfamily)